LALSARLPRLRQPSWSTAESATLARSVKGNTVQDRRKILDKFLSSHHAKDITLRAEIVDYLIGLVPR
jgi:hypothetical protein